MCKKWQAYTLVNLILKKISKIGATRCQIFRLKCTKIDFGWGSAQTPLGELTALPNLLAPKIHVKTSSLVLKVIQGH